MPKAVIARHLKVSRRTLYNWIEAGELDRGAGSRAVRYGPRPPIPTTSGALARVADPGDRGNPLRRP